MSRFQSFKQQHLNKIGKPCLSNADVTNFTCLQSCLQSMIEKQLNLGHFIEWEEWFLHEFFPKYFEYEQCYRNLTVDQQRMVHFVDYGRKIYDIMIDDCDMTIY